MPSDGMQYAASLFILRRLPAQIAIIQRRTMMNTKGIVLGVLLLVGIVVLVVIVKPEKREIQAVAVGLRAPEMMIQEPSGKTYSLADLKGSVVLLNFWASW